MLCELTKDDNYQLLQCVDNLYFDSDREVIVCGTAKEAYKLYLLNMAELLIKGWSLINYTGGKDG